MYLLVGLGNPGKQYENTFHNAGFIALDGIAEELRASFTKKTCKALVAETFIGKEKVLLAKPQTFMNSSGESVRELVNFYKIPLSNVMVFYDDYDIPVGALRIRAHGSAGTHNGMRSIVKRLLRKYKYPPEEAQNALDIVISQCERWADVDVNEYNE